MLYMLTDAQFAELRDAAGDTLGMFGNFLNSAPLWTTLGVLLGLLLTVTIITALILKAYSFIGLYPR